MASWTRKSAPRANKFRHFSANNSEVAVAPADGPVAKADPAVGLVVGPAKGAPVKAALAAGPDNPALAAPVVLADAPAFACLPTRS